MGKKLAEKKSQLIYLYTNSCLSFWYNRIAESNNIDSFFEHLIGEIRCQSKDYINIYASFKLFYID